MRSCCYTNILMIKIKVYCGLVVEQTPNQKVLGLIPTGVTSLKMCH